MVGTCQRSKARLAACWVLVVLGTASGQTARAQFDFEREPFHYRTAEHHDRAWRVQQQWDAAGGKLDYDAERGYLPAVMRAMGISETSQMLVFSKTSFQRDRISPKRPRAVYFNDDTYVGWVQGGEVVEISSVDPRLGAVFYTLEQREAERPKLVRQTDDCLQCHVSPITHDAPGHLVRSVFPGGSGMPILTAGSFHTTHQSPLAERWGGWYVTGTHGAQRHMGNTVLRGSVDPVDFDREAGANVTDLAGRFDTAPYLSAHSDIVALMVLEHQTPAHNQIAAAHYRARLARRDQEVLNAMSGKPADEPIDSIERRYQSAGDDVLECLLFAGEAPLTEPIRGTSGFAEYFAALGPPDRQGRSLRQFDLRTRLFKYPCSYLIYSDAFDALPEPVRAHVFRRLWRILTAEEIPPEYARLSREDRLAIYEILRETKSGLPEYWATRSP